jgi:hypothetical protein
LGIPFLYFFYFFFLAQNQVGCELKPLFWVGLGTSPWQFNWIDVLISNNKKTQTSQDTTGNDFSAIENINPIFSLFISKDVTAHINTNLGHKDNPMTHQQRQSTKKH